MNSSFAAAIREAVRKQVTRRHFLRAGSLSVGAAACAWLSGQSPVAAAPSPACRPLKSFGKAKSVIYLHMAGSPSQLELFDYKPELEKRHKQPCPDELLADQKFAFIKGHPELLGPQVTFQPAGGGGRLFSNLIPELAAVADDLMLVHSCVTDQFNHAPAQLYLLTGNARFGYPSFGSWVTYGLGCETQDLPGFVVLLSGGNAPDSGNAAWGNGFLPGIYQGVQCRSAGDPILFLNDPPGMSRTTRRASLDALQYLNQLHAAEFGDPETLTRIEQYELAFRMQIAAPEVMDISREDQATLTLYGAEPGQSSLANNCLLARRLVEKGVRFVQLFDWGWDVHGTGTHDDLITHFPNKCRQMDRPVAALIRDLKQRGMLEETLVVWGGEFGRTPMNEARGGSTYLGRDHHPHAFTMFMAGAGTRAGLDFGTTDDFGYFVTENPVTVRDLQATLLHALGLDPYTLSFPFQGLPARWIGPTDEGKIRSELFQE